MYARSYPDRVLPSDRGNWSLILTCTYGHTAIAQWLVENGADLAVDQYAPFRHALLNRRRETVKWLGSLVRYSAGWRACLSAIRKTEHSYLQSYRRERLGFRVTPADLMEK